MPFLLLLMLNPSQARSKQFFQLSLYQPRLSTTTSLSAQSTATGGPFLFTTLKAATSSEQHTALLDLLDSYLASQTLTPLERVQFEIQRQWLTSPDSTVAEVEVMFANLPGAAGLPLPDGQMTAWLPGAHLVCSPRVLHTHN
jgi:hypothetical protein